MGAGAAGRLGGVGVSAPAVSESAGRQCHGGSGSWPVWRGGGLGAGPVGRGGITAPAVPASGRRCHGGSGSRPVQGWEGRRSRCRAGVGSGGHGAGGPRSRLSAVWPCEAHECWGAWGVMCSNIGPRRSIICESREDKSSDELWKPTFGNGCEQHCEYRTWIDCLDVHKQWLS